MIKVQQQDGNNDCGLFICAFMETLTLGLDPSQFKFDQASLRLIFKQILEGGEFKSFDGILVPVEPVITIVPIEWGYKWDDKFENLYGQYKSNRSKNDESILYYFVIFFL